MDIKKIILEEINGFDWVSDTNNVLPENSNWVIRIDDYNDFYDVVDFVKSEGYHFDETSLSKFENRYLTMLSQQENNKYKSTLQIHNNDDNVYSMVRDHTLPSNSDYNLGFGKWYFADAIIYSDSYWENNHDVIVWSDLKNVVS